jgi:hypothetical protein
MYSTRYSCPLIIKLEFLLQILEDPHILSFIKIRPVGADLFHAEGRTHITKLIVTFRNFANAPTKQPVLQGVKFVFILRSV